MKMKKVFALLLAVLFVVTAFTACNETSSQESSGTDSKSQADSSSESSKEVESSEASTQTEGDIMTPYGKYPEPVQVSTAKRASSSPNFAAGDSLEDNAMSRFIKDRLNIEIVYDWTVDTQEYGNKLSLMLASNSLPDMFTLSSAEYLIYRQLVDNGMLADLTEAYEKCGGDYMKEVFASYDEENLAPFRQDGALYAIAGGNFGYQHSLLWIRQDWMEKAGITEAPKTLEDMEALLTAWKNNPPSDEYVGMAMSSTNIGGGYGASYSADPIFQVFGATPKTWIKDKNGEVIYGSVAPEMKEGLAVLADWYQKGLIDTQFATRTATGATDALFTGSQTGMAFAPWWYCYTLADLPHNDPDAKMTVVNAPLDASGKFNTAAANPAGQYVVVRKDYEHPEVALKLLNAEFDMYRGFDEEGAELIKPNLATGVDWEYMFPTGGVNLEYNTIIPDVALLARNYVDEGRLEGAPTATEYDKSTAIGAKAYADTGTLDDLAWVHYHGRYLASSIVDAPEVNLVKPVFSFVTDSMSDLKPNLDTLEQTTFLKIVMGELPVDAFDQFVTDWYAQGGQTMTDEVKAIVG